MKMYTHVPSPTPLHIILHHHASIFCTCGIIFQKHFFFNIAKLLIIIMILGLQLHDMCVPPPPPPLSLSPFPPFLLLPSFFYLFNVLTI